jgi:hypothetical protein
MKRPLDNWDLTPYIDEIVQYETHGVLPIGKIDDLRARIWPALHERTGLNLLFTISEVYRELAYRANESQWKGKDNDLERVLQGRDFPLQQGSSGESRDPYVGFEDEGSELLYPSSGC